MAKIYLVRHTKPDITEGICYGVLDIPPAMSFLEEANKISHNLHGTQFDHIFTSPLKRCMKLTEFLFPNNYTIDYRLTEMHFGDWEGKTWEEIYTTSYGKKWMDNYLEMPCPSGESYIDLQKRVRSFINEIDRTKNSIIITHAGIIRTFLSEFKGIPADKTFDVKIEFGEVIELIINDC